MRLIRLLIGILCMAARATVGALNAQPVALDLSVTILHATLGVCVLLALLIGVIVGGLVLTASVVLPMRQRARRSAVPPTNASGER